MKQETIVKFVPELDCKYSIYPMEHSRWWSPNEPAPDGTPCFLSGPSSGFKKGYVYGPGMNGPGYYHVLTKAAHVAVYSKFMQTPPGGCCSPRTSNNADIAEWDDVRLVLHARTRANAANDARAKTSQMNEAMGTAVAMGNVYFHNPKDRDEFNATHKGVAAATK